MYPKVLKELFEGSESRTTENIVAGQIQYFQFEKVPG
jgi:hypothetical protein